MSVSSEKPPRKRLNADQRRARQAAEVQLFAKQYARKAVGNGHDPNDRHFSSGKVVTKLRRIKAEEFDRLLHDDEI